MSGRNIILFVFITVSIITLPVKAEIYKWTDENGNTHYGDKPLTGNNIRHVNTQGSQRSSPSTSPQSVSDTDTGSAGNTPIRSNATDKRQAVSNLYEKMGQIDRNANKANKDNLEDFRESVEEAKRQSKANNKFSRLRNELEIDRLSENFGVANETKERLDNTLTFCQRNPQHYKCSNHDMQYKDGSVYRTVHVQVSGDNYTLSKKQVEEQNVIKAEQKKKSDEVDSKYYKKSLKEFEKIYNARE